MAYLSALVLVGLAAGRIRAQTADLAELTAQEAVGLALQHNREIQQAHQEVQRAEYRITEARAGALPQVHGSWNIDRNLKPMVFVMTFPDSTGVLRKNRLKVGTDYTSSLSATLTQPLYVGGKVGAALKAAKIYRTLATETETTVRQNIVMGTLQAFNEALLARDLEQIAQASLTQAEKHLANVRNRREAGAATDYDLLRARVNAANLRPRLIEAENNLRASLLKLKEIMGIDPQSAVGIAGAFAIPDTAILARADAELAFRNRPEIASGELMIDLQDKAVKIARGDFLPTLAAATTFSYNGNSDRLRYKSDDWSPYWLASLNLTFPIFTGFRDYARYQQARIDLRQAQTEFLKTRDAVSIEVQQAVMDFRKALEQITSQGLNVDEARQAVQIAENLYANGKATQLEVLDAQLALQVAQTNMASALYGGTMADIILKKGLGLLDSGE